mmetsp:Transcript_8596/g.24133  ORF Transcript_8596/g.24133 Transcript_8596/m.24133 type:complete len:387 (+) Transcript_8596:59-1219(+)
MYPTFLSPRASWLLGLALGLSCASSLRLGKLADDPGQHELADLEELGLGDHAAVSFAAEESGDLAVASGGAVETEDAAQAGLAPLRALVRGSAADWGQEEWPLAGAAEDVGNSTGLTRRCGVQDCSAEAAPPPSTQGRRTYVFVMGIEGAGHHAICPLLKTLLEKFGYEARISPINMFGREAIYPFGEWKQKFLAETASWCPRGVCLNCLDSFPYERPIHASASPDFSRMVALHRKGAIDLRVVSIMRNISDSVFSALRRFESHSDTSAAVQSIASSRHFLMEVVHNTAAWYRMQCGRLSTLRYENLMTNPRKLVPGLLRMLGLHNGTFYNYYHQQQTELAIDKLYQSSAGRQYRQDDPELYDKVSAWFAERGRFLWPALDELWCK